MNHTKFIALFAHISTEYVGMTFYDLFSSKISNTCLCSFVIYRSKSELNAQFTRLQCGCSSFCWWKHFQTL